jgi:ELWxxDGT repeat protein
MLKDINSGGNSSFREGLDIRPNFVEYNNELYFYVSRYGSTNNLSSFEMWKTNGTVAGTQLAAQINNVTKTGSISAYDFYSFNDELYFYGTNKTTNKSHLSRTDKATGSIINIENTGNTKFYPVKDKVYFKKSENGVTGDEIWELNKDDSFALVADIVPGSQGINPTNFFAHQDYLYFAIRNATYQTELWRVSNTTAPEKIFSKETETGSSSIDDYFDYIPNGDNLMINTKHFGNSDFAYRMYFVENSGVLTPVLSIRNFDVPYENLAGGLSYLSTFIGNNFYFTGTFNNVGEELLVINFDTVLNINDFETFNSSEKFEFTLYPNPTNTMLNIKSSSAIKSGIIYNLLGKKISEINTNSIDVSRFQSGIYILKLEDELGNIYSKKWIKQ